MMRAFGLVAVTATWMAVTACNVVNNSSNRPDSGVACNSLSVDAGGVDRTVPSGSGSISGQGSFSVKSSYQWRQSNTNQGNNNSSWLSFGLYAAPLSCADLGGKPDGGTGDGGVPVPILAGYMYDPGRNTFQPGAYPVVKQVPADGGYATLYLLSNSAADGGLELASGVAGTVNLTSVAACSLSGSFNGTFETADGGTTSLTGSFSSAFCE